MSEYINGEWWTSDEPLPKGRLRQIVENANPSYGHPHDEKRRLEARINRKIRKMTEEP